MVFVRIRSIKIQQKVYVCRFLTYFLAKIFLTEDQVRLWRPCELTDQDVCKLYRIHPIDASSRINVLFLISITNSNTIDNILDFLKPVYQSKYAKRDLVLSIPCWSEKTRHCGMVKSKSIADNIKDRKIKIYWLKVVFIDNVVNVDSKEHI